MTLGEHTDEHLALLGRVSALEVEALALRAENAKLREVCIAIADALDVTRTQESLFRAMAVLKIRPNASEVEFCSAIRRLAGGAS